MDGVDGRRHAGVVGRSARRAGSARPRSDGARPRGCRDSPDRLAAPRGPHLRRSLPLPLGRPSRERGRPAVPARAGVRGVDRLPRRDCLAANQSPGRPDHLPARRAVLFPRDRCRMAHAARSPGCRRPSGSRGRRGAGPAAASSRAADDAVRRRGLVSAVRGGVRRRRPCRRPGRGAADARSRRVEHPGPPEPWPACCWDSPRSSSRPRSCWFPPCSARAIAGGGLRARWPPV